MKEEQFCGADMWYVDVQEDHATDGWRNSKENIARLPVELRTM